MQTNTAKKSQSEIGEKAVKQIDLKKDLYPHRKGGDAATISPGQDVWNTWHSEQALDHSTEKRTICDGSPTRWVSSGTVGVTGLS